MISHFHGNSVILTRKFSPRLLIAWVILVALTSCVGPANKTSVPATNPHEPIIRNLADHVMVCLSTRNYTRLTKVIEPSHPQLTGRTVAAVLLGSGFHRASLDHWDPVQIQVHFDGPQRAAATIPFRYRRSPNRDPVQTTLTLHFRRPTVNHPWRLYLP